MPFQCPHCASSIVIEGKPPRELVCPACGSSIQVDPDATGGLLPEEAPRRLGKFEFLELLGAGSFGAVYKARDTELDRLVAVKIPRSGSIPRAEDISRFLREARSAAQLAHPGIVSLHDACAIDGTCCLVSEFIQGSTLAERLSAKRFSFRHAAELIAEVAEALHYAHSHGVVHRDLKPSNIMLDLEGRPHLMDFGLAKRAADEVTMTLEGQVLGTPAYMSPEQAKGDVRNIDARSDLYSLGVILYELLTGELPFRGQTRMLLVQVIQDEPRPPRRLNDRIPHDLETICLKAMAKEPTRRYETANGVANDLRRFLKGEPIQARPVGRAERLHRWCRRNPLVASLTAAIAFLLVGGATVATYFAIEATIARAGADAAALDAKSKAQESLKNAQRADAEALNAQNKANEALASARKEAEERKKAQAEKERADREADAAWANQYIAHVNRIESDWENANLPRLFETLDIYRQPPPGRKDVRGWEWYYQARLCSQELRSVKVDATGFSSVAFSADGARLATAGNDGRVKLWDVATGQEVLTLQGRNVDPGCSHAGVVCSVTFSPDGTRLASASHDGAVKLWDAASGEELRVLKGHTDLVMSVAFSADGARLASASHDRTVKLWDAASGQAIRTFRHQGKVLSVAFNPDGAGLVSAGEDGVKFWEASSGRVLRTLKQFAFDVDSLAFSPNGARLATASLNGTVKLWDPATGQEILTLITGGAPRALRGGAPFGGGLAFSPDGSQLASGALNGTVKLWDAASGQQLRTLKGHRVGVRTVAFSPDGLGLVSASRDGTMKWWDTSSGHERYARTLMKNLATIKTAAFSPDASRLASASSQGTLTLWDTVSGRERSSMKQENTGVVESLAFSPDGARLASASRIGVILWDSDSGQELRTLKVNEHVRKVTFSPDGARLASASSDGVKLWDAASGQGLRLLMGDPGVVNLAFSPDGARLASVSIGLTLLELASGRERTLNGHGKVMVQSIAFSPNGTRLASADAGGTVILWDTDSGAELRTLTGHTDGVSSVAFSPDGTRLASASRVGSVKLWDTATGQELRTFSLPSDGASVAFSQDGHWLAATTGRGVVLWDARPRTPEVDAEVRALALVEALFATPLPRGEVLATIARVKLLSEAARKKGLAVAERFKEEADPQKYHAAAWPVIRHPHANVFMCQFALAQMIAACQRAPDNAQYRIAPGVAQYRLGKFQHQQYQDALATLTKADQSRPTALAFLAMTQHQLEQKDQAHIPLARLREIIKESPQTTDEEAAVFLREAADLIEDNPIQSNL